MRRDHKSYMGSPCLSLSLFSCWYFPDHSHPLCATTLAWKVHVIIFSFHATYFHTLLTPLDFRYVNAPFDFQSVDSSATVGRQKDVSSFQIEIWNIPAHRFRSKPILVNIWINKFMRWVIKNLFGEVLSEQLWKFSFSKIFLISKI